MRKGGTLTTEAVAVCTTLVNKIVRGGFLLSTDRLSVKRVYRYAKAGVRLTWRLCCTLYTVTTDESGSISGRRVTACAYAVA